MNIWSLGSIVKALRNIIPILINNHKKKVELPFGNPTLLTILTVSWLI